jgi:two-component system LytT family response regulator
MTTCLIVDDERLAREELRFLLSKHDGIEVIGEAATVKHALQLTTQAKPDVVLLDIQLQGETGFDFVAQCPEPHPHIIFVTAHDAHALRAFDCNALDYLLKPVLPARLAEAIARVRRQLPPKPATVDDMVFLRIGTTARFVPWRSVLRIDTEGDYTRVFLDDGTEGLILRPLKEWLAIAPAALLVRVHRCHLVRAEAIREIRLVAKDRREIVIADGSLVPIGRDFWPDLKALVSA